MKNRLIPQEKASILSSSALKLASSSSSSSSSSDPQLYDALFKRGLKEPVITKTVNILFENGIDLAMLQSGEVTSDIPSLNLVPGAHVHVLDLCASYSLRLRRLWMLLSVFWFFWFFFYCSGLSTQFKFEMERGMRFVS